jgi:hypothetical protein
MANYDYWTAKDKLESGEPYSIESVATTWRNFAEALRNASGHLQGTADKVTEQYGAPYQAFGDRAAPVAKWMGNVSGFADTVASGLSKASTTGSSAQMTMYEEDYAFNQDVDRILGPEDALSVGRANAIQRREAQAATVLNGELDKWTAAYSAFQPGAIDAAPTRAGGSGSDTGGAGSGSGSSGSSGSAQPISSGGDGNGSGGSGSAQPISTGGDGSTKTGNGSVVGSGVFPGSSVVAPGDGDFAGWVKDPRTGFLIDPTSGQEFDPTSGRWIDPVTGKPFGDTEQYASRLEGLGGGGTPSTSLLGGGAQLSPTLAGGGGGSSGLAGLYGGLQPPSLAPTNPAALQLRQQAADSMAAKAYAAQQLALKEASQGGRPFMPPMQAGLPGGGGGGGRAGLRRSLVTEPESTWTNRTRTAVRNAARIGGGPQEELLTAGRAGRLGKPGGGRGMGGAAEEPLMYPGSGTTAAGGRGGAGARGQAAGAAGRAGGAGSQSGNRSYLPPTQAGQAGDEKDRRRRRPDWLVEDDVWSANIEGGPAVLGEE